MDTSFETEELGQCRTRIKFRIPYEDVKGAIDRAFDQVRGTAVVRGFRPGKAPRQMIERKYGSIIKEEAFNKLLPESYYSAVKEKELHPVNDPSFEDIKYETGQPLTFTATVEVMPDFDLPKYKGIEIKKAEIKEPDEEDIRKVFDMHREHHAKYEPVEDRGVQKGDFVLLNIEQEIDGKKNSRKSQMMEVDKEKILPEFVDKLQGMKPVEKNEFDVAFPDDYQSKEVAGKTVHYEIELLEIKKKVLPDLDDDFAKDTGRADTLEGLKEDIRKTLRESNQERARSEEEKQIIDAIVGISDFEIPLSMMEVQTQNNIRRTLQYSMYSGVPREDLIERKAEIHKKASEDSERQIRLFLLLQKIAEAEKISVEEKDVNEFVEDIAKRRQTDPKELLHKMEEDDEIDSVKNRLLHEKILKFLYENAKKN